MHLSVMRLKNKSSVFHRKCFTNLRNAGIGVQVHYMPVHLQPYYQRLGFRTGDYPEAEAYAENAISIPLYPGLTDEEQRYVIETIRKEVEK